jgi:hypothetical protein
MRAYPRAEFMHKYNFYRILEYAYKSLIYKILYPLNYHCFPSNAKPASSFIRLDSQGITRYFKGIKALKNVIYDVFALKLHGLLPINNLKSSLTLGGANRKGLLESI